MPQNRVSTAILEARGSFDRHPERERARQNEPQPTGPLGSPPEGMGEEQRGLWLELSSILPAGVAASSDRWSFEILVSLMWRFRKGTAKSSDTNQLLSLMAKFGLNPSDRSRVAGPCSPKANEFDDFVPRKVTEQ